MRLLIVAATALLAACGVDGPPQPPATAAAGTGVTISGDASVGIVIAP